MNKQTVNAVVNAIDELMIDERALELAAILHVNTVYSNDCKDHDLKVQAYITRWKRQAERELKK